MKKTSVNQSKSLFAQSEYGVLCAATFAFFFSALLLIPIIPKYLEDQGAAPALLGFSVGLMWLPSVFFRPLVGHLIDRYGRRPFLLAGAILNALACGGYSFADTLSVFLFARLFHGLAIASFYAAAATIAGDLAPKERRAEAVAYFSIFMFLGYAVGPALGEHIFINADASTAFGVSTIAACLAVSATVLIKETKTNHKNTGAIILISQKALFPASILALVSLAAGSAETFVPVYARAEGTGDVRVFFIAFALVLVFARASAARIADSWGRAWVIVPGALSCSAAMVALAVSAHPVSLIIASIFFGLGWGAVYPGLFALVLDRSDESERGAAIATLTAAFDLAMWAGNSVLGTLLQYSNYATIFVTAGVCAAGAAAIYLARAIRVPSLR